MPHDRRAAEPATKLADLPGSSQAARARRPRQRIDLTADSTSARVQRMLVLADRFRSMAALKADPARVVELLRTIIALSRETFGTQLARDCAVRTAIPMRPEQQRCVRDLERLLHDLAQGDAEATRGLGHAMDALLIQCFLARASKADPAGITPP